MELSLKELAERIGAELVSDDDGRGVLIKGVGPVGSADGAMVTFVSDSRHLGKLHESLAAAVIVGARAEGLDTPQLVVGDVNAALIEVLKIFAPKLRAPTEGINPSARVAEGAKIGEGACVGAGVVVEENAEIGARTIIAGGCKIGQNTKIGRDSRLDCNVVVYHNCVIGNNVIIQANTTIGSTGFGYAYIDGAHRLIPHNGRVVIEDFVEIGANCCVDRAKFGQTRIGAGTKIDNLVQIAHNVTIGKCCLIVAQAGISGSCRLGDAVVLAGQVGLADNIEIGDGAQVGAQSGVMRSVGAGKQVLWSPAVERSEALRVFGTIFRLPRLAKQLKQLCKRVERLEASEDNQE